MDECAVAFHAVAAASGSHSLHVNREQRGSKSRAAARGRGFSWPFPFFLGKYGPAAHQHAGSRAPIARALRESRPARPALRQPASAEPILVRKGGGRE